MIPERAMCISGTFSRKGAKWAARAVSGTVRSVRAIGSTSQHRVRATRVPASVHLARSGAGPTDRVQQSCPDYFASGDWIYESWPACGVSSHLTGTRYTGGHWVTPRSARNCETSLSASPRRSGGRLRQRCLCAAALRFASKMAWNCDALSCI